MAQQQKQDNTAAAALLGESEKAASDNKKEERLRPLEGTDRDIHTSGGEKVGTMSLGKYHPKNGAPVPVLISRVGGITRTVDLIAVAAAAEAYGLGGEK